MDHAHDVVDGAVVDRQAGVARLGKDLGQLVKRDGVLDGHHVHTGGEDLAHFHVVKLDGAADQFALAVGQLAFALRLRHHGDELAFGDGIGLGLAVETVGDQLVPQAEQAGEGGEQGDEKAHGRHRRGGHLFGDLTGHAAGPDLAEQQDDHRQHHRRNDGAPQGPQGPDQEQDAQGGGCQVGDGVAYQDGGKELVVLLRHGQHPRGGCVPVLGAALEPDLVQGGKGGLDGREKARQGDQGHHHREGQNTAIVHNG